jgi:transcriptional regulator with XRE-family HTH domain
MALELSLVLGNARRKRRVKQRQLARDAKVDLSYLVSLETGRRRAPSRRILERIFACLEVTARERREIFLLAAVGEASDVLERYRDVPTALQLAEVVKRWPALRARDSATVAQLVTIMIENLEGEEGNP